VDNADDDGRGTVAGDFGNSPRGGPPNAGLCTVGDAFAIGAIWTGCSKFDGCVMDGLNLSAVAHDGVVACVRIVTFE
jgi:hypothetical protein